MAWPVNARYAAMAALSRVPSALLNAIQDAILDLYGGGATRFFVGGFAEKQLASDDPCWSGDLGAAGLQGWIALASGILTIPLVFPGPTIITEVKAKLYVASAVGMTARLYKVTHAAGSSATAPSKALVGAGFETSGGSPPYWVTGTVATGISEAIDPATDYAMVEIANNDAGDGCAGVLVTT